jgi:hypothetical protein
MRVLVCGGRDYADSVRVERELRKIHRAFGIDCLIHGGARGADLLASVWATRGGILQECYSADWAKHGKRAGPIRNQRMLDEGKPAMVVAFPGGRGTADMVARAEKAGIAVIHMSPGR